VSYEPSGFALQIFQSRHAAHPGETWAEGCDRVALHVSNAEQGEDRNAWRTRFRDVLLANFIMPGGRIWYGSGRARGNLLNCFVVPTSDSREGWGKTTYDTIVISGTGGGVGVNFSPTRPRGSAVRGTGGVATGAVSEMTMVNSVGEVIKSGGGRRVALMFCLSLSHGDVVEFLDEKLDKGKLNNANVSVVFDDEPEKFFEAARAGAQWPLVHQGRQVGSVPAAELWQRIVRNALTGGEPGLLNGHLANRMSNIWYVEPLTSTNPCVTGDTMIAVADGRNAVSMKQLAEEGVDVPVYSVNPTTGETEVKMGVHPRITGRQVEVLKLTLDDGSTIRATPNHRFMLRDGSYRELRELRPGDSLRPFNSRQDSIYRNIDGVSGHGHSSGNRAGRQYRMIHEFHHGPQEAGTHIHHVNFDSLDDRDANLLVMEASAHTRLHSEKVLGAKNPYHRMSDDWKSRFARHEGAANGMFGRTNMWGHHTEESKDAIRQKHLGMKPSADAVRKLSEARRTYYDRKHEAEGTPRYLAKTCPNESCRKSFIVLWHCREQMYCSRQCLVQHLATRADVNAKKSEGWRRKADAKRESWLKLYTERRFELGRDLKKREWEQYLRGRGLPWRFGQATFQTLGALVAAADVYNHRVVSVESDGVEDVYNITVEDNHNYGIITSTKDDRYITSSGVYTANCGEIWMSPYDCCCLGALVLPRFVRAGKVDWDLLADAVRVGVRFLDDVLTVNNYPLPEIAAKCAQLRRVGLGVTGLHHMLLELGLKYNAPSGLEFVDDLMRRIKHWSYEASSDLAVEKGSFPAFVADKFLRSGFVKTLRPSLREKIRRDGMRNCAVNTIAPTGTISIVCDVSSGIEPIFAPAYERRYRKDDEVAMEVLIDPMFQRFVNDGRGVKHFVGAHDLSVRDHLEMQRVCQRHVDNAVSKTINLPPGTTWEALGELYEEFLPELKGVTVYPDGSRENQPLTPLPLDQAMNLARNARVQAQSADPCRSGSCDL
jgi:ribonucleoside-diphosphate reductase alpha chain